MPCVLRQASVQNPQISDSIVNVWVVLVPQTTGPECTTWLWLFPFCLTTSAWQGCPVSLRISWLQIPEVGSAPHSRQLWIWCACCAETWTSYPYKLFELFDLFDMPWLIYQLLYLFAAECTSPVARSAPIWCAGRPFLPFQLSCRLSVSDGHSKPQGVQRLYRNPSSFLFRASRAFC